MGLLPEPLPSLLGYRQPQHKPMVSTQIIVHDCSSQSALSLAALRETPAPVNPIATIYPHRLPAPIPALTTKHLQKVRETELYENRSGLTLPRHSIGNAEMCAAITLLWDEQYTTKTIRGSAGNFPSKVGMLYTSEASLYMALEDAHLSDA